MPIPTRENVRLHLYPRTVNNTELEKAALTHFGYPEDYLPELDEAKNMLEAYLMWKEYADSDK